MKMSQKQFLAMVNGKEVAMIASIRKLFPSHSKAEIFINQCTHKALELAKDSKRLTESKANSQFATVKATTFGFWRGDSRLDIKGFKIEALPSNVYVLQANNKCGYCHDETFSACVLVYAMK